VITQNHADTPADLMVVYSPTDDLVEELGREGLVVRVAPTLGAAVQEILAQAPAAVLLLVQDEVAVESCAVLRALGGFPIVVSPQPLPSATVAACLDAGADLAFGYPASPAELAARLQPLLQRVVVGHTLHVGELVVDPEQRVVTLRGTPLDLTPTEFRLLAALAANFPRVVSTSELLRSVWGDDYFQDVPYVRLYIGYLRAKIEEDRSNPRYIVTQRGVGYRLKDLTSGNPSN
jgi:DNA-binding response OmpR family regulator